MHEYLRSFRTMCCTDSSHFFSSTTKNVRHFYPFSLFHAYNGSHHKWECTFLFCCCRTNIYNKFSHVSTCNFRFLFSVATREKVLKMFSGLVCVCVREREGEAGNAKSLLLL